MPFQIKCKYGLLTYAQCGDLDPFQVVNHLAELGAECIIGRENHADGGIHLHAFFMFDRPFRSRNERVFDVAGCHPNIVRGYGTPEKGFDYATKDGEIVAGGLERPSGKGNGSAEAGGAWSRIVMAETREEFYDLVEALDPRALCLHFGSLRAFADWRFRVEREPYHTPEGVRFCLEGYPELARWSEENLAGHTGGGTYPQYASLTEALKTLEPTHTLDPKYPKDPKRHGR